MASFVQKNIFEKNKNKNTSTVQLTPYYNAFRETDPVKCIKRYLIVMIIQCLLIFIFNIYKQQSLKQSPVLPCYIKGFKLKTSSVVISRFSSATNAFQKYGDFAFYNPFPSPRKIAYDHTHKGNLYFCQTGEKSNMLPVFLWYGHKAQKATIA